MLPLADARGSVSDLSRARKGAEFSVKDLGFLAETFFISVLLRIALMALLSLQSAIDIGIGHDILLGQSVGQKSHVLSVKEVEHPVIHVTFLGSEFIDAIPQVVSLRPAELVAEHGEPSNGSHALSEGLFVPGSELSEPLFNRDTSVIFLVENNCGFGHCASCPAVYNNSAITSKERRMATVAAGALPVDDVREDEEASCLTFGAYTDSSSGIYL